jgi:exonuclease III
MLRVASWNMNHWRGSRSLADHGARAWEYLAAGNVDIALAQEAVAPSESETWGHLVPRSGWNIGKDRPWGSGIATREMAAAEVSSTYTMWSTHHSFELTPHSNYEGAVAIADIDVPSLGHVTAISVYAVMKPVYAQTTLFHIVADLIPLFDSPKTERRHFVLGGDLNAHTQAPHPKELPRYEAILHAIESLGLVNCFKATAQMRPKLEGCPCNEPVCYHVQTRRHPRHRGTPKERFSGHLDYLFASPELADSLSDCFAVGSRDESVWELSDHCPVVADFDV